MLSRQLKLHCSLPVNQKKNGLGCDQKAEIEGKFDLGNAEHDLYYCSFSNTGEQMEKLNPLAVVEW